MLLEAGECQLVFERSVAKRRKIHVLSMQIGSFINYILLILKIRRLSELGGLRIRVHYKYLVSSILVPELERSKSYLYRDFFSYRRKCLQFFILLLFQMVIQRKASPSRLYNLFTYQIEELVFKKELLFSTSILRVKQIMPLTKVLYQKLLYFMSSKNRSQWQDVNRSKNVTTKSSRSYVFSVLERQDVFEIVLFLIRADVLREDMTSRTNSVRQLRC